LRVADRPTTKFTTLPLAEVVLRDEAFTLTDYVAPRLRLPADHPLNRELAALARRVREKAVYVSERARSHRSRSAHEAAEGLRLPLTALTEHLPELEALLSSGNAHPFTLYLTLCRLAGGVTALTNFAVPPQGRGYQHDDIRRSYRHLVEFIGGCLDQIRQEFTVVPFDHIDGGFQLDLKTQPPQRELTVAAQVAPGLSADATWSWLADSLIAAPARMDELRRRRILGAPRRLLSRDEAIGYTLAGDTVLFAVTLDESHVGPDDTICVVNTAPEKSEVRPVQLFAYLVPESDASGAGGSQ
jgi:type VI secretion system protein ImpJ